ncbi:MAG TPA: hypothetical protein VGJ88_04970 [Thermoanaerobaculia bacterium]
MFQALLDWVADRINLKLLEDRVATGMQEAALLWFVFSMLDKLVTEKLTKSWVFSNCAMTLAVWLAGTYLEVRRRP